MVEPRTESKQAAFERMIEKGDVGVILDPRASGVVAPPWLKKEPKLVLQIGLNMAKPIRDLKIDEDGFRGTLSFSNSPSFCNVPWSAVFALRSDADENDVVVWPDDVPDELKPKIEAVRREPPRPRGTAAVQVMPKPLPNGQRQLHSVVGATKKPRPSHLRLVKK